MIKPISSHLKPFYSVALATNLSILLTACSFQHYQPKPIDSIAIAQRFEHKNPAGEPFHLYLVNNGYLSSQFPIQQWGLDELTYCALFFHPSLDVARAQWRATASSEAAAFEKTTPSINSHVSHSNQANQDISPFALGLSIDIPIDTVNKREIRIDNARHLSLAAKLEIAQTAWELRNQVAQSLNEYQLNQQLIKLLLDEQDLRQQIVNIYQKRVNLGVASNVELSTAKLQFQITNAELSTRQQAQLSNLSKLASNLGLPLAKVESLKLSDSSPELTLLISQEKSSNLQTTALLNRVDIRIALEKYAASEAKLKLEIAKQYPDITISPGYAYEFGDRIWSLGLSSLLNFLNKNKLAIAEATQLREVEAAQFEALQTKVIAEANIASVAVSQSQQALAQQQALLLQQQRNTQRMQRKLAAGEIDRLEFTYGKFENIVAEKNVALAKFQLNAALNQLENALQIPLNSSKINANIERLSVKNSH